MEKIVRPILTPKNKGGAPKGNRNARKHGLYSAGTLDWHRQVRRQILSMWLTVARAYAAVVEAYIAKRGAAAPSSPPQDIRRS